MKKKGRQKRTVICEKCATEMDKSAMRCKNCGSHRLTPLLERRRIEAKIEKRAMEERIREIRLRERGEAAKTRYNALSQMRHCLTCNEIRESDNFFCTTCGSKCELVQQGLVTRWMAEEFPDLIQTGEDLEAIRKVNLPEPVTLERLAVGTAKFAGKAAVAVVKTAWKQLNKY